MDTPALGNGTSARSDPRADASFLLFNCAVLTLTLVLGLPGNLWVCWVVLRTKSLQTCNNALLVSLAASDLLKCSVDTPLLLFSFLRYGQRGPVSVSVSVCVCSLQQFTYALCSCVQLLTLVGISAERFQAIAHPFRTEGRRARVRVWILSIWACGLALAAVSLSLSEKALLYMLCRPHTAGPDGERAQHSDPFGPYVLVPVWGLCITLIVVHYLRIFRVVRQHRKKVFNRGVQLRPTVSGDAWAWVGVPAPSAPGTRSPLPPPPPPRRAVLLVAEAPCASAGIRGAPGRPPEIVGAVCLMTPGARERGKKQMEGKVAQRFGYIIIAFTLFWAPMVVLLLVNVISPRQDRNKLLMELETSAMVLTCMQAAVDPLLYTLVTRQFRSELRKILSSVPGCPLKQRA
ncbi:D(4) dopamine receptor-like [Scophthalmus maximus]|uniref:D(4) dopamine receptor-like n=1 Tax=Scophthalmus maximus TaxID=52904 RepID=UPI001FA8C337|nr:D(4) dopamine receptor-like [Scophthalmus maximus]